MKLVQGTSVLPYYSPTARYETRYAPCALGSDALRSKEDVQRPTSNVQSTMFSMHSFTAHSGHKGQVISPPSTPQFDISSNGKINQSKASGSHSSFCSTKYLNNPSIQAPFTIDLSAPKEVKYEQIFDIIAEITPQFLHKGGISSVEKEKLKIEDLTIKPLIGGLSNLLFLVSKPTSINASEEICHLLVRAHSIDDDEDKSLVNRNSENKIMAWLASLQSNAAPTYYGRFQNGRLEEFYDGVRPLTCHEMREVPFARAIAIELANMHKRIKNVPAEVLGYDIEQVMATCGEIWKRIDDWIELADLVETEECLNSRNIDKSIQTRLEFAKEEWAWLKSELKTDKNVEHMELESTSSIERVAAQFCRQIVFTHMDCQSLNILTPKANELISSQGECKGDVDVISSSCSDSEAECSEMGNGDTVACIRLIDFEYAGLNPRAADIANTFCEHCDMNNFKADYEKEYPTSDEQNLFLKVYVQNAAEPIALFLNQHEKGATVAWMEFLEVFREEIGKHSLLSHLSWFVWSLDQFYLSSIDFDYLAYADLRKEGYEFFKNRHWPELF